jgi:hypothetical protein
MIERARMLPEGWLTPELHDHALLLVVNAFKDKVVRAPRWSIEDLVRIVRRTSFDLDVFVARTVEARSTTIVWFVANWLACAHADRVWQCVRDRIAKRPRRQVYQHLLASMVARAPEALATRLLARLGSDEPRDWVEALTRLIWWEAQTGRQRRRRR